MICNKFGNSVGLKFDTNGDVLQFEGNTIISLLDHNTEVFRKAVLIRNDLEKMKISKCVTFLPDESLHMTVIEGVCDKVREKNYWTSLFPLDVKLTEIDKEFENKFVKISPFPKVLMSFYSFLVEGGICISLKPSSEEDKNKIEKWRDEVSDVLGLKFPNHNNYGFHISLAYGIEKPNEIQLVEFQDYMKAFELKYKNSHFEFEVPNPNLTYFNNMLFFNKERFERI
jgi:hypothetical protein